MKRYVYTEFDDNTTRDVILTEKEILDYYWKYWSSAQWSAGVDPIDITPEDCIEDFCIVHWAEEMTDEDQNQTDQ